MKASHQPVRLWQPDKRFLVTHLYLPLLAAVFILTLLELAPVDLWLADRWFAFEGYQWSLRQHWLTATLIHRYGKDLIIMIALVLIACLVISSRFPRLQGWRRPIVYLLTCLVVLPGVVAAMKYFTAIPCPWDLDRYGGNLAYQHNFRYLFGANEGGHCFPAGHASGGFALVTLYFAAYRHVPKAYLLLLPGLLVGTVFALSQEARGAHFLSHDLTTLTICWFGGLGLFLLIKPYRQAVIQQ